MFIKNTPYTAGFQRKKSASGKVARLFKDGLSRFGLWGDANKALGMLERRCSLSQGFIFDVGRASVTSSKKY